MIREGNFGYHEAISMIIITITIKAFFSSPSAAIKVVGTASWYMTLISATTAAGFFMFQYILLKRFPNMNIMEIADRVLGKIGGSILSFLSFTFFIVTASIDMREFVEVMKIFVLPESPISFIMVIFALSVVFLCFMGLENIARFSKFIIYILAAGFFGVVLMSVPNFKTYRIFPILGYGLNKTIVTGMVRSSFYGAATVIGVFAPSLQGNNEIKKIGFTSIFISGIITSLSLLAFSLTFPYATSQELVSPMYAMASMVNLGTFFQRIEPIFLFLWNFGTFVEITVLLYAAIMIYCHIFHISDKRPVVLPMVITLYGINLIPESLAKVATIWVHALRMWGWIPYFMPSVILLIAALIRGKKGDANNA